MTEVVIEETTTGQQTEENFNKKEEEKGTAPYRIVVLKNYTNVEKQQSGNNSVNADSENNNVRTPISGINLGAVALPKIDIKKVNEASRAKSLIKGASSLLET